MYVLFSRHVFHTHAHKSILVNSVIEYKSNKIWKQQYKKEMMLYNTTALHYVAKVYYM